MALMWREGRQLRAPVAYVDDWCRERAGEGEEGKKEWEKPSFSFGLACTAGASYRERL